MIEPNRQVVATFTSDRGTTEVAQDSSLIGTAFSIKDGIFGISKISKEQKFLQFYLGFNADNASVLEKSRLIAYLQVPQNLDTIANIIEEYKIVG